MQLEVLYKRTSTGSIQFWEVKTEDDIIVKTTGQLGTAKPIVHREAAEAKNRGRSNETSRIEQAGLQAKSDWTRKKDSGYKTWSDLGIFATGFSTSDNTPLRFGIVGGSPKDDSNYTLAEALQKVLPQFNTDANGNIKPMLATDWNKIKKIDYPVICEPKLDGVRCLLITTEDGVTFLSRSGKEYTTLGHITPDILKYLDQDYSDFILDGEIYSDEISFQEIISAVKKQRPDSLKLKFRAYDVISADPQNIRKEELEKLVILLNSQFITSVDYFKAESAADVKKLHDEFVQQGNEGAILRLYNGKYAQGQRSRELLKVKEFMEEEFVMTSFEYGQRGAEDLIAVCTATNGKEFRAKMQGSKVQKIQVEEEYQEAYEIEKDIKLTVKFFGLTNDGIPRFPIGKALRTYE